MSEIEDPNERPKDYYFFGGDDVERLPEYDTYDPKTGEGRLAYTGTATWICDAGLSNNPIYEDHLIEITIPASINSLGYDPETESYEGKGGAFEDCKVLETVIFEEGSKITLLNRKTFQGCTSLKSIALPESIETIEYNAFIDCTSLEEIVIPDKVTTIGDGAFAFCTSLKYITLGSGVKSIGEHGFYTYDSNNNKSDLIWIDCSRLEEPPSIFKGTDKRKVSFPVGDGWTGISATYKIYVPDEKVDKYKQAWPNYCTSSTNVIESIKNKP